MLHLRGYITPDGNLRVDLPERHPIGEVYVTIEAIKTTQKISWEDRPWNEDEIAELLRPVPLKGGEIVEQGLTGGWEHLGIVDGQMWVDELRQKVHRQ